MKPELATERIECSSNFGWLQNQKNLPYGRFFCEKGEGDQALWMRQEPDRKNYEKTTLFVVKDSVPKNRVGYVSE